MLLLHDRCSALIALAKLLRAGCRWPAKLLSGRRSTWCSRSSFCVAGAGAVLGPLWRICYVLRRELFRQAQYLIGRCSGAQVSIWRALGRLGSRRVFAWQVQRFVRLELLLAAAWSPWAAARFCVAGALGLLQATHLCVVFFHVWVGSAHIVQKTSIFPHIFVWGFCFYMCIPPLLSIPCNSHTSKNQLKLTPQLAQFNSHNLTHTIQLTQPNPPTQLPQLKSHSSRSRICFCVAGAGLWLAHRWPAELLGCRRQVSGAAARSVAGWPQTFWLAEPFPCRVLGAPAAAFVWQVQRLDCPCSPRILRGRRHGQFLVPLQLLLHDRCSAQRFVHGVAFLRGEPAARLVALHPGAFFRGRCSALCTSCAAGALLCAPGAAFVGVAQPPLWLLWRSCCALGCLGRGAVLRGRCRFVCLELLRPTLFSSCNSTHTSRNSTYATQLTHLALCNLHPSTYLIQFKQLNLHQASNATQVTHQQLTPLNLHNLTYTSHFTQLNSHNVTQTYTTLLTQLNWRNLTHTQLNSHK